MKQVVRMEEQLMKAKIKKSLKIKEHDKNLQLDSGVCIDTHWIPLSSQSSPFLIRSHTCFQYIFLNLFSISITLLLLLTPPFSTGLLLNL